MMKIEMLEINIKIINIIKLIDELKSVYSFKNEDNNEDYLDTIEGAVTSLAISAPSYIA